MNRSIKDATVRHYHYGSHDKRRQHLGTFVAAYNYGRRLKVLKSSHPTKPAARHGEKNLPASPQTRTITLRD